MKRLFPIIIFLSCILQGETKVFVLCEGNFNTSTAALWQFDDSFADINGPVFWNTSDNPLGDTGQSLTIFGNYLYIVVNNSHTIEILDISNNDPVFHKTILVPNASPRDICVYENKAYISCWLLSSILEYDLNSETFTDTIQTPGKPEDVLLYNGKLYSSIIEESGSWDKDNKVVEIDLESDSNEITNTYEVLPGPNQMAINNNELFVTCTHFNENWQAMTGTSKIDLSSGVVTSVSHGTTKNSGADICYYNNSIFRTLDSMIVELDDGLEPLSESAISNFGSQNIYSMAMNDDHIFVGLTDDFQAPDDLMVLDMGGNIVKQYSVSALPGSFGFFTNESLIKEDLAKFSPHVFLHDNYPNPFNPKTNISFSIQEKSFIEIKIFDISGRELETLASEDFLPGVHLIQWNGAKYASGCYFYQIKSENFSKCKKMVLLK